MPVTVPCNGLLALNAARESVETMVLQSVKRVIAGFWNHGKPFAKKAAGLARSGIVVGLRELKTAAAYYWAQRDGLWRLLGEYVTFFKEHGTRKEIWVSRDDDYEGVSFDGSSWRAELPDCCVVCGEPSDEPWSEEERSVPILSWPLWAPIVAAGIGFVLGVYFGNRWILPISVPAGLWIGYRRRDETCVRVRFRRCRQHAEKKSIPRLRFCKGALVIDVGHRAVYRKFWERERSAGHFQFRGRDSADADLEHPLPIPTWEPPSHDLPPIPLVGDDEADGTDADTGNGSASPDASAPADDEK